MPNYLGESTSPYLIQHAANPVDWFPWGEEAFDEAQNLDRPVHIRQRLRQRLDGADAATVSYTHLRAHET